MKSFRALYGYNYVQNGWMGDIYSLKVDNINFLKAVISPSQPGVGRRDYSTWVAVSGTEDCKIETGLCSCPAGKGRSCSHISAVIYAITLAWASGVGGETCTDKQQAWGKGVSQVLNHNQLSEMNFRRPSPFVLQQQKEMTCTDNVPKTKQFIDHSELKKDVMESSLRKLWECKGTLLNAILNVPEVEPNVDIEISHGSHEIDSSSAVCQPLPCESCNTFYNKNVNLSNANIYNLAMETKNQNNNLWQDSRRLRITSSKVHALPKSSRGDPNKYVTNQIYNRFKGCVATRHGNKYEPVARSWFEGVSGKPVMKCGIVVSNEEPYIGASPNGKIDDNTIIEIKCPTKPLKDMINTGKYDVVLQNGQLHLNPKGKNGYYCQVQLAMFCTKARLCKFIVWTAEEQVVLDVLYNEDFIEEILPRVRNFYFKHLLVRLTDEHLSGRLKLSPEYKRFCN
ncbi:uncharacterized protein LOC132739331 isoform X2 [Ruditapes philippinarum]|nr:uncharacterized protein LOC132739331 isoform X2 [Ruditapes philippinarum]